MLYFDNTRLTSDRLHELIKFCEHKRLPETIILCEGSTVFAHIQGYHVKVVSRSTGIRTISASDFNDIVLKMGKTEFKHGLQAYHDTKQEKLISYAKSGVEPVIRSKNGRKYQQVKWKPKEATGERELLRKLLIERGARSEISGEPLITDENHPNWTWQLLHCVPKSLAEQFRLREDNVFLGTTSEHQLQTNRESECRKDPKWRVFFETQYRLRQEYERRFAKTKQND